MIKITPNKERVRSILLMISLIERRVTLQDEKTMSALIIFDYYEIIKELATALVLLDGFKTTSHKELIIYIKEKYCNDSLLDDIRILRNRITYEGFQTDPDYLRRNKCRLEDIKNKLKNKVTEKLDNKNTN